MYIDGNFNIFHYTDDPRIVGPVYECDELIAPAISYLNKAGFKTIFCCSGHATDYTIRGYNTETHEELEDIASFICCYISFRLDLDAKKKFETYTLPTGFEYDDECWSEDHSVDIRYRFKNTDDKDAYFIELLDLAKILFFWAKDIYNKECCETYEKVSNIVASGNFDTMKEFKDFNVLN